MTGFFVTNIGGGHAHNPILRASDYVTGRQIEIDGGWLLGGTD